MPLTIFNDWLDEWKIWEKDMTDRWRLREFQKTKKTYSCFLSVIPEFFNQKDICYKEIIKYSYRRSHEIAEYQEYRQWLKKQILIKREIRLYKRKRRLSEKQRIRNIRKFFKNKKKKNVK